MKDIVISLISSLFFSVTAFAASEPVKMSNSGICHAPNTSYYEKTKNYTPYKTLDDYLKADEKMPIK